MGYRLRLIAPNVIIVAGLLLDIRAIVHAFQGQLVASAYLIIFASIVETLDGAAARLLHASSALGGYLDTLSDVVTFGWRLPSLFTPCISRTGAAAAS